MKGRPARIDPGVAHHVTGGQHCEKLGGNISTEDWLTVAFPHNAACIISLVHIVESMGFCEYVHVWHSLKNDFQRRALLLIPLDQLILGTVQFL